MKKDDDFDFYTRGEKSGKDEPRRRGKAPRGRPGDDALTRKAEEDEFEFETGKVEGVSDDTKILGRQEGVVGEPTFAWLVIVEGDGRGIKFDIFTDQNIIGRGEQCHIQLEDSYASELHAIIAEKEGVFHAWDLGSKNGTKLNGEELLGHSELSDGDTIEIGKTKLVFKKV